MKIRNNTGTTQVLKGKQLPAGVWLDVPGHLSLEIAMDALRLRIVDVQRSQTGGEGLFWMSALSVADGYGTAAENFVLALKDKVSPLHIRDCWFRLDAGLDKFTVERLKAPVTSMPERGLCMATPGEFRQLPTKIRLGFTMYESDEPLKLHPEWAHDCREVDALIVPSQYSKDVFGEFYDGPIHTCDLIVHPDFCNPVERKPKDTFTFITYGTLNARKSPKETLAAFQAAFPLKDYPDVRMEFKTRAAIFGGSRGHLPHIDDPRVKIIDKTWYRDELLDWLYKADCMLFATKGEGYGMPPREALCTGMPVIYANHTGMRDLEDYAWPVMTDYTEDCPIGGLWRIPDWDELIEQMRCVYEHREQAAALSYESAKRYIEDKGDPSDRLLAIINETEPYEFTARGKEFDHTPFFAMVGDRVTKSPVYCVGHNGAAELRAMGYQVVIYEDDPLTLNIPEGPIVWLNGAQDYSAAEIRRLFHEWPKPIYFAAPAPQNRDWAGGTLRQRGEWSAILQPFESPMDYYHDKRFVMGEVKGEAVSVQGITMGAYIEGVWHPNKIEAI